ncbi:unnamed protein product [marine sediment metagenome]|uniref:SLC41A/MgtE integral membrane domain-containing protein n=1 Tax=marine sediment metagenome TaxID=412755 RepID=X1VCB4_9ZZZZ
MGLILGLICGLGIGIAAQFWPDASPLFGFVVGIAMFIALAGATTFGALLPALFKRLNIDPAVAAGPLATTVIDIAAVAIYLGLATMLLRFLV